MRTEASNESRPAIRDTAEPETSVLKSRSAEVLAANEAKRSGRPERNRASSIGHPCMRWLVYQRTREPEPFGVEVLRLFAAGRMTERALIEHLTRSPEAREDPGLGLTITRQQERVWLQDGFPKRTGPVHGAGCSGHIEGVILTDDGETLFEVKSINAYNFGKVAGCRTVDEAFSDHFFYQRYPAQGQVYMSGAGFDRMLWFICPRGDHLNWHELTQERDDAQVAALALKSRMVDDFVAEGKTPDPVWIDRVCDHCPWLGDCFGAVSREPGEIADLDDPQLSEALDRIEALSEMVREHNRLKDYVKARCREVDGAQCGRWTITGKWQTRKAYSVNESTFWVSKQVTADEDAAARTSRLAADL